MGSTRALLLAGVMALGAATAAQAADMPLPPPPAYVPPPEPIAYGGWYLRGDVGGGFAYGPDIRSSFEDFNGAPLTAAGMAQTIPGFGRGKQTIGDVGFIDVGVGYQLNNWLRFDVTGEIRSGARVAADEFFDAGALWNITNPAGPVAPTGQRDYDHYSSTVQSSVFLVNAYADLGTWYSMTPFVGVGVGAAYNILSNLVDQNTGIGGTGGNLIDVNGNTLTPGYGLGGGGYGDRKGQWNFAFAGMAGVSYALTSNLKLEFGYRYLNMGEITSNPIKCFGIGPGGYCANERQRLTLASNDFRVGLRWLINDTAPVYVPPPLPEAPIIRKY